MIFVAVLPLLGVIAGAAARLMPISHRQVDSKAAPNPFASIEPSKDLRWVPCFEDSLAAKLGPVSCARLIAPLDYAKPSRGEVQLAIVKLGVHKNGESKRTVFVNNGGPGGDPVDFIATNAAKIRTQVGNDIDLIGVTPRAVGSTFPPITCDATDRAATQRAMDIDSAQPGYTNTSLSESCAAGRSLGLDCSKVIPDLIPYVGTFYVAKDHDHVLRALGQDKFSYLGYSYGTVLGATYAGLFPHKVDRMVLDAVVDFDSWYKPHKVPKLDIGDADKALDTFFHYCFDAGSKKCAFWYNSPAKIRERFFETDRRLFEKPIPVPGYGLLKTPLWRSGVYSALYKPVDYFPLLASLTAEVYKGVAGPAVQTYVQVLADMSSPTVAPLVDKKTGLKNSPNGNYWIGGSDSGGRKKDLGMNELEKILNSYLGTSSFFGGLDSQYEILVTAANLPAKERFTKFGNIKTKSPILFVGNTADPTTPLASARKMSEGFPGSHLLTINGTGHISYSANPTLECAKKWIAPYFQEGTLPPPGTVCQGRQAPFG